LNPVPPIVTTDPAATTVSTEATGTVTSSARSATPPMLRIVGRFALAAPTRYWLRASDWMNPWSVFTTSTVPNPLPSGIVVAGVQVSTVGVSESGTNGPKLWTAPLFTKSRIRDPGVNPEPVNVLLAPIAIGDAIASRCTCGAGDADGVGDPVTVAAAVRVMVAEGVRDAVGVRLSVGDGDAVADRVALAVLVAVPVAVRLAVAVALAVAEAAPVAVGASVAVLVAVTLAVRVVVALALGVAVRVAVGVPVDDAEAVALGVTGTGVRVGVALGAAGPGCSFTHQVPHRSSLAVEPTLFAAYSWIVQNVALSLGSTEVAL
jgi:hypothetical protein